MKKTIAGILSAVMTAVMLTITASAAEFPEYSQDQGLFVIEEGGAFAKDLITGEVSYLPPAGDRPYAGKTVKSEPENAESERIPQAIMPDNRVVINDTTAKPSSRQTVHIKFTGANGQTSIASGCLIAPNLVLTAGHVVYNPAYGGGYWASEAIITPGRQVNGTAPYGTAKSKLLICGGGWMSNYDYDDDWGVIVLDTNIGDRAGWFQLNSPPLSYFGKKIEANGYDGQNPYTAEGTVSASKSKTIESTNIYTQAGMSGGPCYIKSDTGVCLLIGVISLGLSYDKDGILLSHSIFRKIDKSLYNNLISYCEEYAA